ncbi:MAG: hypothetical protein ACYCTL_08325 [Acidimicrobiales bacterium]
MISGKRLGWRIGIGWRLGWCIGWRASLTLAYLGLSLWWAPAWVAPPASQAVPVTAAPAAALVSYTYPRTDQVGNTGPAHWRSSAMPSDPIRPTHYAWEPGIARGPGGVLWAVADHCQLVQQFGACQVTAAGAPRQPDAVYVWRSTDGGRSWTFIADPIRIPIPTGSLGDAPGGIDTDIAVEPRRVRGGHALVSVVSNWGGGVEMAVSADGGHRWVTTELDGLALTDRPWIAARGVCTLYLTVHPVSGALNLASVPFVARYDVCAVVARAREGLSVAPPESIVPVEPIASDVSFTNQDFAKLVVTGPDVFVPYVACDAPASAVASDPGCNQPGDTEILAVAASTDGGRSFRDIVVARGALAINLNDGTWPLSLALDRSGIGVLVADTGERLLVYESSDLGRSWYVAPSPATELGWPFAGVPAVAVSGRNVALGWYGSPAALPGLPQRYYLVVARWRVGGPGGPGGYPNEGSGGGTGGAGHRSAGTGGGGQIAVLPVVLATLPYGQALGDTLSDDFAAKLVHGHPVFVIVESCSGHPSSDTSCPPLPAGMGRPLVARYAWLS